MATSQTIQKWATADKAFKFHVEKVIGGLEVKMIDVEGQSDSVIAQNVAELDEFVGILQKIRPFLLAAETTKTGAPKPSRVAAEELTEEEDGEDEEDEDSDEFDDEDDDDSESDIDDEDEDD